MIAGSFLSEAVEYAVAAAIGSSAMAPLVSFFKRLVGDGERTVAIRMPSGAEVRLELDKRLSEEEVSALVTAAVQSSQAGNEAAVERTVAESRAASEAVRAAEA